MYFRMMPFTFSGGSQETNTTELDAAAALTPAGGPGTVKKRSRRVISYFKIFSTFCVLFFYTIYEAIESNSGLSFISTNIFQ